MDRLRHRPDYFMYRGNRFYFHRLADGPTLARLDPYSDGEQKWPMNSGRVIDVTAAEIRDITFQVHGIELPEFNPDLKTITDPTLAPRITELERQVAELAARINSQPVVEPVPVPVQEPAIAADPEPVADPNAEILQELGALKGENVELRAELDRLREEATSEDRFPAPHELMSDWGVTQDKLEPAPVVEEIEVEDAPAPDLDPNVIPDHLAYYAQADETAGEFRNRLKGMWQRFGIEDGKNFVGGGEPLTSDEKIKMRDIDMLLNSEEGKNAGLLPWLYADEKKN